MKKNFFKKLSFVMALAMTVSLTSPAAGAFAAAKPKLNATKKYLQLDVEKANEYDFNIKNKKSGWKYQWTSSNAKVATVNKKNGVVTAEGVGTAKVTVVISDKAGEEVAELKATIVVRDNIKELNITKVPEGNKLAVGVENDFNRSFKTVSGSTKKTSAITRWSVDKEGATINDSGVFKATVAGEYTITARSFQSKEKYNLWLSDAEKYASYVLATDTEKVTVASSMTAAKQVDLKTFTVTFDSAVTDVKEKLTATQVVQGTKVVELIDSVEMDADNKVAKVKMYTQLTGGNTYVIEYPGMEAVEFVAAKSEVADVADMKVKTTQVQVYEPKELEVTLLNKEGVDITTDELKNHVTFETENKDVILIGNELTMNEVGKSVQVKATFHTYNYNNSGEELGNFTAIGTVSCVEKLVDTATTIKAYTIAKDDTTAPDFDDAKHSVSADKKDMRLFLKLRMDAADGKDFDFNNIEAEHVEYFEFRSSNENIIQVNEDYGYLYPNKAGSATIVVKYDGKEVGAVAVTVLADRKLTSFSVNSHNVLLSNDIEDERTLDVTVKDQYGDNYDSYEVTDFEVVKEPTDGNLVPVAEEGNDLLKFTSDTSTKTGTYTLKVTVEDTNDRDVKRSTNVTVDVKDPDDAVKYYQIETNKSQYDLKVSSTDDEFTTPKVEIKVYGYDKHGWRNQKYVLGTSSEIASLVKWGKVISNSTFDLDNDVDNKVTANPALLNIVAASAADVAAVSGDVSGAVMMIQKAPKGDYRLEADKFNGITVRPATFKIVDTQKAPTYVVDKKSSEKDTAADAVRDIINIKLNNETIDDSKMIFDVTNDDQIVDTNKTVRIKKVFYYEEIKDNGKNDHVGFIKHEIKIGLTYRYDQ